MEGKSRSRPRGRQASGTGSGGTPDQQPSSLNNNEVLDKLELTRQLERIERDLGRRERELEEERAENERVMERNKKLERDRQELRQELEDARDELSEYRQTLEELETELSLERSRSRKEGVGPPGLVRDERGRDLGTKEGQPGGEDDLLFHAQEGEVEEEGDGTLASQKTLLTRKNQEIGQLLEDIEKLEDEKHVLQDKLTEVTDSLQSATQQIESMAQDHFDLKGKLKELEEIIKKLQEEKSVLEIKERDLLAFKERHDQYLENLSSAVDVRVDVWQRMMLEKDEELDKLNKKIEALQAQAPSTQSEKGTLSNLKKKLKERETQIEILKKELSQATLDLESVTQKLEAHQVKSSLTTLDLKGSSTHHKLLKSYESKLRKANTKLQTRTKALESLEAEATEWSREKTELLNRVQALESGEYGLKEAVTEIKCLRKQLEVRDQELLARTGQVNSAQLRVSELQDENEMLRERVGLEPGEDLSSQTLVFTRSRKAEVRDLQSRISSLEADLVDLRTKNYGLRKQLGEMGKSEISGIMGHHGSTHGQGQIMAKDSSYLSQFKFQRQQEVSGSTSTREGEPNWKRSYDHVLGENSELRKGLQEILDTLHAFNEGETSFLIQSPVLENLLREMSARGLINYPHSIAGFHLKVCNLEGKNEQLREEIHSLRLEEKQMRGELIEAKSKIHYLEEKFQGHGGTPRPGTRGRSRSESSRTGSAPPGLRSRSRSPGLVDSSHNLAASLDLARTPPPQEGMSTSLTSRPRNLVLEDLQLEVQTLRDENNNLKLEFKGERAELEARIQGLETSADQLMTSAKEGLLEEATKAKSNFLLLVREHQRKELKRLIKEIARLENENNSRLSFLERFKAKALQQIILSQNVLESSVPVSLLYSTRRSLLEISTKYQELSRRHDEVILEQIKVESLTSKVTTLQARVQELNEELSAFRIRFGLLKEPPGLRDQLPDLNSIEDLQSSRLALFVQLKESQESNSELKVKLGHLKDVNEEWGKQITQLKDTIHRQGTLEKDLRLQLSETTPREESESLRQKLLETQEALTLTQDDALKWREMADFAQNQIRAFEKLKKFEKIELESLLSQVTDLQALGSAQAEFARLKRELLTVEREKVYALDQVQKLQAQLSSLQASTLQHDKVHTDRELSILSMHTQVIHRYRSLFASLHESSTSFILAPSLRKVLGSPGDLTQVWDQLKGQKSRTQELETELGQARGSLDEALETIRSLRSQLEVLKVGRENEFDFDSAQKVQEARVEVARWRRKAQVAEEALSDLRDSLQRAESKSLELEEERIRLEHSIELKDSLTSTMLMSSDLPISKERSRSRSPGTSSHKLTQTETMTEELQSAHETIDALNSQISELQNLLQAKDQVLNEIQLVQLSSSGGQSPPRSGGLPGGSLEQKEALLMVSETVNSLQERLKAKDENLNSYRKLLAEARTEMSSATERHIQEMKALQSTILQQQQSFTRMKTTLSHPMKDTPSLEGTMKEQLTRINELEDEVSELHHSLGNMAAQLANTRGEVHRWRGTAESRLRELDVLREQQQSNFYEEVHDLRHKVKVQQDMIAHLQGTRTSTTSTPPSSGGRDRDHNADLIAVLKAELDERHNQLEMYSRTLENMKASQKFAEKHQVEEKLLGKEKELIELKEHNKTLQQKVSTLQVKLSKLNASNKKSGISEELEDLRNKVRSYQEDRQKLEDKIKELELKRKEEDDKKRQQTMEGFARWEEGKKWQKTNEKLEARLKTLEADNTKLNNTILTLKTQIINLEKEKLQLEKKLSLSSTKGPLTRKGLGPPGASRTTSRTSAIDRDSNLPPQEGQGVGQGKSQERIERLKFELETMEKFEFEAREEVERLRMEVKVLKERVVIQERQLTAYQVAQKGDPKIIAEIEKMGAREDELQKELLRFEEDNLYLKLQLEELRLETPRLRDRVHHLERWVETLKSEKNKIGSKTTVDKASSQRSLTEFERTISALKGIIEKLQLENKRLKIPVGVGSLKSHKSTEKLKSSLENLMGDKKELLDKIHHLEHEKSKLHKMFLESNTNLKGIESRLMESEKRARSAEMKLRTFLSEIQEFSGGGSGTAGESGQGQGQRSSSLGETEAGLLERLQTLREVIQRKDKVLSVAKATLQQQIDMDPNKK